jgi:hypothetical protein
MLLDASFLRYKLGRGQVPADASAISAFTDQVGALPFVVVSAAALEAQHADNDIDVANVLKRSVATPLYDQIERIAALAARCERATA